ncbi:MAG: hypothetical protein KKB59_19985 [Spirochaetes bacterium]|nr:hypothetical protein [Spirochaetota bacterium]
MLSRNARKRQKKRILNAVRVDRQEEAKTLRKVTIRSEVAVRHRLKKYFNTLMQLSVAKVPTMVPDSIIDTIHPDLRAFAQSFWIENLAKTLHERANDKAS